MTYGYDGSGGGDDQVRGLPVPRGTVTRSWARIVLAYTDPDARDGFPADLTDLLVVGAGAPVESAVRVVGGLDVDSLDDANDLDLDEAEEAAYDLLLGLRSDLVADVVLNGDGEPGALVATARSLDRAFDALLDAIDGLTLDDLDAYRAAAARR
ncbi:MAG: hypothetical protein ACJ74O_18720 [Frankiaceae bacterium]